ncbi:packaged DNA stabilization protein [Neorhizobium sp. CSC1952]|uniref:packaged DNA stabilization protein n=1 Tax=Neorhizobium sp. CSC1952 TaxID=2978974 RepID=UPI0025A5754C|nr:packaged DNA stabilization protein [Rhizobium sp. CSC1952]WJR67235.1 packaged DNA stabilization protein [Rhizobium sp. CSC1952]
MVEIVFPITTAPGERPGEGAGRLINCYAEKLQGGARAQYARRRSPGLRAMALSEHNGMRGMHFDGNGTLYIAQAERLSKVTVVLGEFAVTDLGELPGTGRVTFARNNKAPVPDILCVTENDVYVVDDTAPPVSLGEGDLPQPLTVCFLAGYFIFAIRDGRVFFSAINDTTVSALDFGKAENRPGGIYGAYPYGELLLLCGPSSIEVWQNAGNATGSPFSRAAVIPRGIASTFAIAGFEDGFSSIVFVGDDNGVYLLSGGYTPTKISTPDLDRLIEKVTDKTTLDVTVSVTSGHNWVAVTGPGFTWEYEVQTGLWHERKSYQIPNWRAICSAQAFGGWVVGDRETGQVWMLDAAYQREGLEPLVMSVFSQPASGFPNRVSIPRADFDFIVGQGLVAGEQPIETDPVVLISWSDDGGNAFGIPVQRKLGPVGRFGNRVTVNRCGVAGPYGRVWRLDISDPVYASLQAGQMDVDPRSR